MPGFDINRFVDPNAATELASMTCFICQDVFNYPVMTKCCIKPWVESNHTCPNDHKPLKIEQLEPAPVLITNLLNSKKVKCSFANKGCPEVS